MEFGIDRGICMEENPPCEICGVREYCLFRRRDIIQMSVSGACLGFSTMWVNDVRVLLPLMGNVVSDNREWKSECLHGY
jgi:hypothetical protein